MQQSRESSIGAGRPPGGRCAAVAGLLLTILAADTGAVADTPPPQPAETTQPPESPWLLTPTASSDPKLGTSVGAIAGYLKQFDPHSTQSLVAVFGTYSDTDSWVAGIYGELYFHGDRHKIVTGAIDGRIHNEYDDFLGTGVKAKTDDDLDSLFARYLYNVAGGWYLGVQALASNYVIGAEGLLGDVLEQIGLVGFDSIGLGLVAEYDSRDNRRNPTRGNHSVLHNVAYRKRFGGDESFDTYTANASQFLPFGAGHVLGIQFKGRWTSDAPLAGYSSLSLRGYTRGNYLAENYTHLDLDARFHISGKWGASLFAGVGCLYDALSDCDDGDNLYPAAGAGVIYTLKPEAGIVIRAEYAVGESDNSAFYLSMGHPF